MNLSSALSTIGGRPNDDRLNSVVALQAFSSRITALNEIAVAINQTLDLDEILQLTGRHARWLIDFDYCGVCLCEPTGERRFVKLFGLAGLPVDNASLVANFTEISIRTKQVQLICASAPCVYALPFESHIVIPMESEGEVLGTLHFASAQAHLYTQEDVRVGSLLALQLTGAIRNAKRFAQMNTLYTHLEQTYADLRQAEQMRDELVHMIVHDLRNPLTTIDLSLSLLDKVLNSKDQSRNPADYIDRAQRASRQVLGMINELLVVSKLEAGELQLCLAPVDFAGLARTKIENHRAQAGAQGKSLTLHLPHPLPPLLADAELIGRVLDNLLSNALKHTATGGVIEVCVVLHADHLTVYVRDQGPGIPPDYRERIFEKFVQVQKASGAPVRQGTGLGLAFCRLAVGAHGGDIWVDATSAQGSTFAFTLPLGAPTGT